MDNTLHLHNRRRNVAWFCKEGGVLTRKNTKRVLYVGAHQGQKVKDLVRILAAKQDLVPHALVYIGCVSVRK